jgi:hypothetical protein
VLVKPLPPQQLVIGYFAGLFLVPDVPFHILRITHLAGMLVRFLVDSIPEAGDGPLTGNNLQTREPPSQARRLVSSAFSQGLTWIKHPPRATFAMNLSAGRPTSSLWATTKTKASAPGNSSHPRARFHIPSQILSC